MTKTQSVEAKATSQDSHTDCHSSKEPEAACKKDDNHSASNYEQNEEEDDEDEENDDYNSTKDKHGEQMEYHHLHQVCLAMLSYQQLPESTL